MKKKLNHQDKIDLAHLLAETWEENENEMAEMAAYYVACEQLGIDQDYGWELLSCISDES